MRWIAWLLVAACSSGPSAPAHPAAPPASPPTAPAEPEPSERECDELITHAVVLGIDERAAADGPRTTESDHEAIRRALHAEMTAGCRALPRSAFRCALAAPTLAAMAACQRSPSSSTSNSKVAPGGMTPPAPRSP